ncbi:MobF family relaxase [Rhodanobacter sp. DHB23]|uniref:MobF family relaxase n=1 Tax=Rhodanobacter sp. DHB23 TaxID=2775923 RepID=UPI00177E3E22|nr:MobF family relaxase [Rhodanobacter sp. DHB23]MBD8872462.1 relaxase domain-containing protein [Rhodanobacter sp. DHB23]
MLGLKKIKSAALAFNYYSERDDYYLSDQSAAAWYGRGAADLGLRGDIDPTEFRDVLAGSFGATAVKNPQRHTPGWDVTFSAPKSVSIAALVNKDERLTAAHDMAVRAALDHIEAHVIITRQRDATSGYAYRNTGNLVAGVVRHSTSRNLDPQLHSHAVIANATRDPVTGRWASIDSRQGLYACQIEAGNVYMNTLADGARRAGYEINWKVNDKGAVCFDLLGIPDDLHYDLSSRRNEVDDGLAKRNLSRKTASAAAREAVTLDTRSPKEHVPPALLHQRWEAQAAQAGYVLGQRPADRILAGESELAIAAEDAAVRDAITHLSERETRFTARQIMAEARKFSQGRADEVTLGEAVQRAHERGDLVTRETMQDVPGGRRANVAGFTTRQGEETERQMLAAAQAIAASGKGQARIGENQYGDNSAAIIDAAIECQEALTGHRFSAEQRAAVRGILSSESGLHVIQGFAGTAKTTTVLATIAEKAREAGWRVQALAPTNSAAKTLGDAIGAEAQTVAAANHSRDRPGQRRQPEVWIVDEAGMVSAGDKRDLLRRAQESGARVILVGDDHQIGSVGAGAAFEQIKAAHADATHELTDIKRQRNEHLREAVYDALSGKVSDALDKVDVREHATAGAAAEAVADDYMRETAAGRDTLVVTLSRADRDEVNKAIQQRRVDVDQVHDVQWVSTLRDRQMTETERADAAHYRAGDVVEAGRDFRGGPKRGELAEVTRIEDGRVTALCADGREWIFDPAKSNKLQVSERVQTRIGTGDRIVAKGTIRTEDGERIKNGSDLIVDCVREDGRIEATDTTGRRHAIDSRQGAKIDLAYAQTANQAQGRTVDVVIANMRSGQRKLADRQRTYVALSRARERAIVHTDDRKKLAAQIESQTGRKEMALPEHGRSEEGHNLGRRSASVTPDAERRPAREARSQPVSQKERGEQVRGGNWKRIASTAGHAIGQGAERLGNQIRDYSAKAPRRRFDRNTKKMLRNIDIQAQARLKAARRGRSMVNPIRHMKVAAASAGAERSKAKVRGMQVVAHARWEAADTGRKLNWQDPKAQKILVRSADGRTARSSDGGRTFTEERGIKGLIDRHQAAATARREAVLEQGRREHRMRGGGETANSQDLARRALETHQADQQKLIPPQRDWDAMAAKHGVEYDRHGHRYAHDGKGGLHSEALTKRSHAMSETQRGREVRSQTDGRTAGAVRGMLARRAVEKTIKGEREAEIQRLERLAGDGAEPKTTKAGSGSRLEESPQTAPRRGAEPKTTKAGSGSRFEVSPQTAPRRGAEPKTTKAGSGSRFEEGPQAAPQRGAEPKTTKVGSGSRLEEGPQAAPQRGAEPKTTKVDAGKSQTPTDDGHRSRRDKGLKW